MDFAARNARSVIDVGERTARPYGTHALFRENARQLGLPPPEIFR